MPFNGGGFSGSFGFGQAPQVSTIAPGATSQSVGVKQYGAVWASYECDPCDIAIREMQAHLLRVSVLLGFKATTKIDGKVGSGTVSTLQRIMQEGPASGAASLVSLAPFTTPESVARNADKIRDILRQAGDALQTTRPPPNANTPMPPPRTLPGNGNGLPPSIQPVPSKLPYIIGGGILLAGVIAVTYILTKPRGH